jgi:hypothetical protein
MSRSNPTWWGRLVLLACVSVVVGACTGGKPRSDAAHDRGTGGVDTPADMSGPADAGPDEPAEGEAAADAGVDAPDDMGGTADVVADMGGAADAGTPADMSGASDAGADAPPSIFFNCIEGWPAAPSPPPSPVAPRAVEPRILWTIELPPIQVHWAAMVATGTGVAVVWDLNLRIVDGEGTIVKAIQGDPAGGILSFPVAGPDGSLYLADALYAIRIGPTGDVIWRTPLEPSQSRSEFTYPHRPLLDHLGRLYVAGLDGNLWTIESETGRVAMKHVIGLPPPYSLPRNFSLGVADVVFASRTGLSAAGPSVNSVGPYSPRTGTWEGEISDGNGWYPSGAIAGWDIGIVASGYRDVTKETTETIVLDRCGRLRWRVPGSYALPMAITFGDDLIVRDMVPKGTNVYTSSIRRFSRDGTLLAGPAPIERPYRAFSGADDTLYLVTCGPQTADGLGAAASLVALGPALQQLWSLRLPDGQCPGLGVMNGDGKIFVTRMHPAGALQLLAIQTPSPGLAPVSWPQFGSRDARGTDWLPPGDGGARTSARRATRQPEPRFLPPTRAARPGLAAGPQRARPAPAAQATRSPTATRVPAPVTNRVVVPPPTRPPPAAPARATAAP